MKGFISISLKFIGFLVPVFIVIFIIWSSVPVLRNTSNIRFTEDQFSSLRLKELKKVNNIDILFIGSSLCYRGFDTRIFKKYGYNTFNVGTSSQTPMQTKYLLKQYLKKLNPKLVIYSIDPFVSSIGSGVESATNIISNRYLSDSLTIQMVNEQNDIKVYNTFAYCFLRNKLLIDNNQIGTDKTQKYIPGGYVEKMITYYKYDNPPSIKYNFDGKQLNALKEITHYLKRYNQDFFFVFPPITSGRYKSISNSIYFVESIKMFGDLYNFNGKVGLDDSLHFYDDRHLNQRGVEIYNHKLLEVLGVKINTIIKRDKK